MKTSIKILFLISFISAFSLSQSTTPQECVEQFFVAFHKGDTLEIKEYLDENVIFKSLKISENDTSMRITKTQSFLNSIAFISGTDSYKEEIHSFEVSESENIAHVMAPYTFYLNEKVLHKGVNSFLLIRIDGRWKITHLLDTRKDV